MPQLDISTYASQLFWLFVTLGALLSVMHRVIVPRYLALVMAREKSIKSATRETEKTEEDANNLEIDVSKMKDRTNQEMRKLLANERHALSEENIVAREKIFSQERKRLRFELKRIAEEDEILTEERATVLKELTARIMKTWK